MFQFPYVCFLFIEVKPERFQIVPQLIFLLFQQHFAPLSRADDEIIGIAGIDVTVAVFIFFIKLAQIKIRYHRRTAESERQSPLIKTSGYHFFHPFHALQSRILRQPIQKFFISDRIEELSDIALKKSSPFQVPLHAFYDIFPFFISEGGRRWLISFRQHTGNRFVQRTQSHAFLPAGISAKNTNFPVECHFIFAYIFLRIYSIIRRCGTKFQQVNIHFLSPILQLRISAFLHNDI